MLLKRERELLERCSEALHVTTLLATASALLLSTTALTEFAGKWVEEHIKQIEVVALAVLVVDGLVFILFAVNRGKRAGSALKKSFAPLPNPAPGPVKYAWKPLPITPGTCQFVSGGAAAEAVFKMNFDAVAGSEVEMEEKELKERNERVIAKNAKAFMLVREPYAATPAQAAWIGYTCVLPLNAVGEDYYLNGKLLDTALRASMVCGAGEQTKTFVLFGFELTKELAKSGRAPELYNELLRRYADEHAKELAKQHAQSGGALLWVEASHDTLEHQLKGVGYSDSGKKSAYGWPLYSRQV
jgi:hypothetical protein